MTWREEAMMLWRETRRWLRMCVPGVIFWAYVFQIVVCVPLVLLSPDVLGDYNAWFMFAIAPWFSRLVVLDKPDPALGHPWKAPWWRPHWGATVLPRERRWVMASGAFFAFAWLSSLVMTVLSDKRVSDVVNGFLSWKLVAPGAFIRFQEWAIAVIVAVAVFGRVAPLVVITRYVSARQAGLWVLRAGRFMLCPSCLYSLDGLEKGHCPECGRPFRIESVRDYWRDTYRAWRATRVQKLKKRRKKRRKREAKEQRRAAAAARATPSPQRPAPRTPG